MRRALGLVIIAVLAAACGKKQPPASAKPPAAPGEPAQDADKPADGAAPDSTTAPRTAPPADPCMGGE